MPSLDITHIPNIRNCVYLYEFPDGCFYIGECADLRRRHLSHLQGDLHCDYWFRKYPNTKPTILARHPNRRTRKKIEILQIKKHRAYYDPMGLNRSRGDFDYLDATQPNLPPPPRRLPPPPQRLPRPEPTDEYWEWLKQMENRKIPPMPKPKKPSRRQRKAAVDFWATVIIAISTILIVLWFLP